MESTRAATGEADAATGDADSERATAASSADSATTTTAATAATSAATAADGAEGVTGPAATSARPLLLTVLGDLVLPSGGRAWLGALTATMEVVGIAPSATRQALRRLVAQDLVLPERHGRRAAYTLTPMGRRRLEEAADRIYLRRPLV